MIKSLENWTKSFNLDNNDRYFAKIKACTNSAIGGDAYVRKNSHSR